MFGGNPKNNFGILFGCLLVFQACTGRAHADSILDGLCKRGAHRYTQLHLWKKELSAKSVIESYSSGLLPKLAERDAQAVWRKMNAGSDMNAAIDGHLNRYYSDLGDAEKAELRKTIVEQVATLKGIRDLLQAYETSELTPDLAAQIIESSWRSEEWSAPHPIDYYVALIKTTGRNYQSQGMARDDAAVRAAVDIRDMIDLERGVSASMVPPKGSPCYTDSLWRYELWLRGKIAQSKVKTANDEALKFLRFDYPGDRFDAWSIAAHQ